MVRCCGRWCVGRWSRTSGVRRGVAAQGYTRARRSSTWASSRIWIAGWLPSAWWPRSGGDVVERYMAERRAAGYVNYRSGKAMRPLLDYLGGLGVLLPDVVPAGPVEKLLERYRCYLSASVV